MLINYYINNIIFCSCEEGSIMDIVLQDIEKKETERLQRYTYNILIKGKNIEMPQVKKRRNILYNLTESKV